MMELNLELDRLKKYNPIEAELRKAEKKHPIYPTDMFRQVAIMNEEAGEVTKAVLHYHYEGGSLKGIKDELIQTAAMCMRMLKNLKNITVRDVHNKNTIKNFQNLCICKSPSLLGRPILETIHSECYCGNCGGLLTTNHVLEVNKAAPINSILTPTLEDASQNMLGGIATFNLVTDEIIKHSDILKLKHQTFPLIKADLVKNMKKGIQKEDEDEENMREIAPSDESIDDPSEYKSKYEYKIDSKKYNNGSESHTAFYRLKGDVFGNLYPWFVLRIDRHMNSPWNKEDAMGLIDTKEKLEHIEWGKETTSGGTTYITPKPPK